MKRPVTHGHYRALLVILIATICIWFGASMSDINSYPTTYEVDWNGYDDARYVVVTADSTLTLGVKSNGFRALGRSLSHRERRITVNLEGRIPRRHGEQFSIGVRASQDPTEIIRQLRLHGVAGLDFTTDSLHITLAERRGKPYVPQIRDVDFGFAPQFGISGPITLIPDTVFLYGSTESLNQVKELYTRPGGFANINSSDTLLLDLEPVWSQYPDLHPSHTQIRICLPVSRYAEGKVTIPVTFQGIDTAMRYRIYPDKVEVTYWAPSADFSNYTTEGIQVSAWFDPDAPNGSLPLVVSSFPGAMRIKKIEPDHVKFVILK